MKKIFILLIILMICTGCVNINNNDNKDLIIDEVINNNNNPNTMAMGYEYYLPIGFSKVYDKDYNQKLKYENNFIYLYVDIVSYFYKNQLNFTEENNSNSEYYKKITSGDKTGYIKISKEKDNLYYIKIVYNYAKIETYATRNNINELLTNSMIILNSIDYNDNLIEKILENNYSLGVEKEYKIDKPEDATSKFSEYLSEYIQEEESKVSDLPEY